VAGNISLIRHAGSYLAYDYIIRLVGDRPGAEAPREPVWAAAIQSAHDAQAVTVALAAYQWGRPQDAATAFARARQSANSRIAALAGYDLGLLYGELGRSDEAIEAYQRVIDDYGHDPTPALREIVSRAREALQDTNTA
jgi:tetratricopeptide (TPR) repeat protein